PPAVTPTLTVDARGDDPPDIHRVSYFLRTGCSCECRRRDCDAGHLGGDHECERGDGNEPPARGAVRCADRLLDAGAMTADRLAALTRGLEGRRVSVALVDGSRIDDC